MASKSTVKRQKSAGDVVAAGRTHKSRIAQAMGEIFGSEVVDSVELLIDKTVAHLEGKTDEMVKADEAHAEELRDDPAVRTKRDGLVESTQGELVTTREQLSAILGDEYVARLGFEGTTPDDPVALSRIATTVAANLGSVAAPKSRLPGYTFEATVWADKISSNAAALKEALVAVDQEAREAEATITAKHRSIEEYDKAFSGTANLLSVLLQTAGDKELAKRVRPSSRRAGQTTQVAENK